MSGSSAGFVSILSKNSDSDMCSDHSGYQSSPSVEFAVPCSSSGSRAISPFRPARVATPEWIEESPHRTPSPCVKLTDDLTALSDLHFELEVIERRIELQIDKRHGHPALAVLVRKEEGLSEITRKERKLRANYNFIEPIQIIPKFWKPRAYDHYSDKLTAEQTEQLEEKIRQAESRNHSSSKMSTRFHCPAEPSSPNNMFVSFDEDFEFSEDDYYYATVTQKPKVKKAPTHAPPPLQDEFGNIIKRKRGRPRKYPRPDDMKNLGPGEVVISMRQYCTDDSDDMTEWDDI